MLMVSRSLEKRVLSWFAAALLVIMVSVSGVSGVSGVSSRGASGAAQPRAASGAQKVFKGLIDRPTGIAVSPSGRVVVAQGSGILSMDSDGANVSTAAIFSGQGVAVGSSGQMFWSMPGQGQLFTCLKDCSDPWNPADGFSSPDGIAVDGIGQLFVADTGGNRIAKVLLDGTVVSLGSGFASPAGVAVDTSGRVFVSDTGHNRVVRMNADGTGAITIGTGFLTPGGIGVDAAGHVFVADSSNNRIVRMNADGTSQVSIGSGFFRPHALALDTAGHVFVADTSNNRIVRMGIDGGGEAAIALGLHFPWGVAADEVGRIFVADSGNNRIVRMNADGTSQVSLGSGLLHPHAVSADNAGHLFVADSDNNRIVRMNADGTDQVTIGTGFSSPNGIAADTAGHVYVADTNNSRIVRMDADGRGSIAIGVGQCAFPSAVAVDRAGHVFTASYGGDAVVRMNADGTEVSLIGFGLASPLGLAVDKAGRVVVADTNNDRIVRMNADGSNQIVIGPAISSPRGVAADSLGAAFVADANQSQIIKMSTASVPPIPTITSVSPGSASITVGWTDGAYGDASINDHTISAYRGAALERSRSCSQRNPCTITGLANGVAYTIRVSASSNGGTSAPSAPSKVVTPVGAPYPPGGVHATLVSGHPGQVLVTWEAAEPNGAAVERYEVGNPVGAPTCVARTERSCVVDGVTPRSRLVRFTVVAVNAVGPSKAAWSDPLLIVWPPSPPRSVTAANVVGRPGQVIVRWVAPATINGGAVVTYAVSSSTGGYACSTTSALTCTIPGVSPGSMRFSVTATNAAGVSGGSWSPWISVASR